MFIKVIENRLFFLLIAFLFKLVLDISYFVYIVDVFAYSNFNFNFNFKRYIIVFIAILFLTILTSNIMNKISDYFFGLFLFLVIYPLATITSLNFDNSIEPLTINFIFYLIILVIFKIRFFAKSISIPYIKNGRTIFLVISIIMIIYLIFLYIVTGAILNFNLDFSKIYDFRDINAELTNFGITAYLNSWVYQVFSIALIAYFLLNKKYIYVAIVIGIQIFFFGVAGHKSILFSPLMVLSIYFYLSKTRSLATIPLSFFIIILLGLLLFNYDRHSLLASILIRRIFFVPADLTFSFFNFFNNNQFNYWSDSFLSFIQERKYFNSIPQEIGSYLGTNARANNGLISSGFSQAGYLGIFIYSCILIFILKLLDNLSSQIGSLWFPLVLVVTPIRNLISSSDLFTVLLTHGFLVAIIMLILFRKKEVFKG